LGSSQENPDDEDDIESAWYDEAERRITEYEASGEEPMSIEAFPGGAAGRASVIPTTSSTGPADAGEAVVVMIMHHRQRPDIWLKRLSMED
jgi:hypothetical protein